MISPLKSFNVTGVEVTSQDFCRLSIIPILGVNDFERLGQAVVLSSWFLSTKESVIVHATTAIVGYLTGPAYFARDLVPVKLDLSGNIVILHRTVHGPVPASNFVIVRRQKICITHTLVDLCLSEDHSIRMNRMTKFC